MALDDLEFVAIPEKQWPDAIRTERESNGRPCITTNKLPVYIDQVVGDERQNRPEIKVIPVDDKADVYIAEILSGYIKNIEQTSNYDVAIDHAFEHAVTCGYGALRVNTEYSDDDSFEQDIVIKKIDNALSIYWGKHSEYDCSDAPYCFVVSDISREDFKNKYKSEPMPFNEADSQYVEDWCTEDKVRVCEYFVKEPIVKTIYLLEDGRVVEKTGAGDIVVKKRKVNSYKIHWYLLSGNKVLDDREIHGKYIPIIPVWGKEVNVGGKRVIRSLIRNAKDPQRMYNYWQSCDTELVALAPKFPFLVTPKQIAGHESQWDESNKRNFNYLLVNPDAQAPGWPQRQMPPQASSAMVEKIQMADQEIRDTTGLQKASLGMASNERSGKAIMERQKQGDIATFAFIDNLARSITYLGRVLVDLAPYILDTERIIRMGMEDGLQKFEAINVNDGDKIINDLSIGKYDVVATVGPSFATQREEARRSMSEFIQYYPQAAPFIGDLFAESMDWKGADKFAERLRYLLPPELKAKIDLEQAKLSGKQVEPPQPQQPSPEQIAKMEEDKLNIQKLQIELEQEKVKLQQMQVELQQKAMESKDIISKIVQNDSQHMTTPMNVQQIPPPPTEEEFNQFLQTPEGQQYLASRQLNPIASTDVVERGRV